MQKNGDIKHFLILSKIIPLKQKFNAYFMLRLIYLFSIIIIIKITWHIELGNGTPPL